jgi:hypothetical protein
MNLHRWVLPVRWDQLLASEKTRQFLDAFLRRLHWSVAAPQAQAHAQRHVSVEPLMIATRMHEACCFREATAAGAAGSLGSAAC